MVVLSLVFGETSMLFCTVAVPLHLPGSSGSQEKEKGLHPFLPTRPVPTTSSRSRDSRSGQPSRKVVHTVSKVKLDRAPVGQMPP